MCLTCHRLESVRHPRKRAPSLQPTRDARRTWHSDPALPPQPQTHTSLPQPRVVSDLCSKDPRWLSHWLWWWIYRPDVWKYGFIYCIGFCPWLLACMVILSSTLTGNISSFSVLLHIFSCPHLASGYWLKILASQSFPSNINISVPNHFSVGVLARTSQRGNSWTPSSSHTIIVECPHLFPCADLIKMACLFLLYP